LSISKKEKIHNLGELRQSLSDAVYRGFSIDLAQFQGNGGWFLPIPATLVVGRDGRVKARFVDPDFRHRMPTEDIVEAVREAAQN
jgi:peroxiredoxin